MTENTADARFTRLYSEYYDEVLAYCTRRIGRREADDATADVFAIVWRRLDEVRWESARPWLYGIARRVLGNRWRSFRRRQRLLSRVNGLGQTGPDPPHTQVVRHADAALVLTSTQERSREMKTTESTETGRPQPPPRRRGQLLALAAFATVIIVGIGLWALPLGGGPEPGPVSSLEDIAGTYQRQGPGYQVFIQFFEDGTWHFSTNRDLVEDRPEEIMETRFEGTKAFLKETKGLCDDDPDAIYEIHLLENGNLQLVAIEDPCAFRSGAYPAEWAPVP